MTDFQNSAGPPYDARAVANLMLERLWEIGSSATQMQLYKMVYFAHGWHLASDRGPLVQQQFEAWDYGPVVRILRDAFKCFGKREITQKAERLDIFTGELTDVEPVSDPDEIAFIQNIVDAYHRYDGWHLSEITHEEGSPWDEIWNSREPVGKLALRIDDEAICSYFVRLPQRFAMH
ncbi:Panacea domain-containing protein [Altererythrobacter sp. MF3-039]|uniref:Panacea domain-containing protein n=1 Tax=Altererythrobacter sp. MF3-039 TaxID=3252901 RepID=UPI00390C4BED